MAKHHSAPQCGAIRTLAWIAFPFALGALVGGMLTQLWVGLLLGGGLALVSVVLSLLRGSIGLRPTLCGVGLAMGFLWCALFQILFVAPKENLAGETQVISATLLEEPTATTYSYKALCSVSSVGKVYLYGDGLGDCTPGDTLSATATFGQTTSSSWALGIYLYASLEEVTVTGRSQGLLTWPGRAAARLRAGLSQLFSGEVYAFYCALLTGDKSAIPTSLSTALSRCGLRHMVAVSGLHMGILAGVLMLFIRRKGLRLLCLPVLLFFTLMVGAVSAWRALLMELLLVLAPVLHRESDQLTSLAFALFILTANNPLSVGSVSLQLSFGAMLGLFLFTQPMYQGILARFDRFSGMPKPVFLLLRWVIGAVTTALGAGVITIPLTAWYFRQVSLVSAAANVLVVWMLPVALCAALVAAILVWVIPGAATILALLPGGIGTVVVTLVRFFGTLNFAALPLKSGGQIAWFFLFQGIVVLMIFLPKLRRRPLVPIFCMAAPLAVVVLLGRLSLESTSITVEALSVGEGQCVLLTAQGQTAALDCGGNAYTSAGDSLADQLQSLGENQLDALIITHFDSDHTNGLPELFARIQVKTVYIPDVYTQEDSWRQVLLTLAEEQGTEVVPVEEVTTVPLGEGQLTLYPPIDRTGGNNGGLTLLGEFDTFRLLSTGDMDTEAERILLARYSLPDIDLLLVGHHGSGYSTSERLLAALTPEVAIVSVGENRYGHPTQEALWRLTQAGAAVYRTDQNGTITIRVPKSDRS